MKRGVMGFATLVMVAAMIAGARLPAGADESVGLAAAPRDRLAGIPSEYRIGPADVLHVSVWKNEFVSRTVPVRPDGMISLPLVNDVRAAGLTPMQLRDAVKKKLADYIPNPEVSVIVVEMHSFAVSVLGEVKTAGRYELRNATTVLDLLAQAGGITEFASRSGIFILRTEGGATKRIPFNYNRVISAPDEGENIFVRPGDILVVP